MSTDTLEKTSPPPDAPRRTMRRRGRTSKAGMSMLAQGEPMIWLTGGALAFALLMILGLIGAVLYLGLGTFAPQPIVQYELLDGTIVAGEVTRHEEFDVSADTLLRQPQVGDNFLGNMVDELGGHRVLDALPKLIQQRTDHIQEQLADIDQKIKTVQDFIKTGEAGVEANLAAVRGGKGPVGDRLELILASAEPENLSERRAELQTLKGKKLSLDSQIESDRQAIEYLTGQASATGESAAPATDAAKPDGEGGDETITEGGDETTAAADPLQNIVTAPDTIKKSVLNALLDRLADQRGQRRVTAQRRLVRVGNKSPQNSTATFKWVADYEIKPDSMKLPEWFVVVERTEWGRFYAAPKQFVIRRERNIPADEQELDAIVTLFDQNIFSLEPQEQDAVREVLEPTREKLAAVRQEHVERFLAEFKADSAEQHRSLLALPDFGEPVAVDDVEPTANIVEVQEVWETPEVAWSKFEQFHEEILARSKERYDLKKHDLGEVSRKRDVARKELRRHELEVDHQLQPIYREKKRIEDEMGALELTGVDKSSASWTDLETHYNDLTKQANTIARNGVNLVAVCTEVRQYETLQTAIEESIDKNNALVKKIAKRFGPDSAVATAAKKIVEQLNATELANRQEPDEKLSELRTELARAPAEARASVQQYFEIQAGADTEDAVIKQKISNITAENERYALRMETAAGKEESLVLDAIVRAYPANQVHGVEGAAIYGSRWWEFLTADPREANSEGGVFPAIWGTVIMTLIMSLAVAPFGVLAALYLREYAKAGPIVSAVRISINNLAGVPSIVFGVFGLGFFCYGVGSFIDGGPDNAGFEASPAGQWYLGITILAAVAVGAFVIGLAGITKPGMPITPTKMILSNIATLCWIGATCVLAYLIIKTPFFSGFYETDLPNPVFGKGGVLWASLTLALLTLPVVIVATEEALSAVPNSMRDGSYGCGASKWQTIRRIVLPHALPGIMTGMILAMARGAGEVAPLMLVGAVKLAPELPLDGVFPFVHPDRSFMHLGFHIFDLGFQSQDSEAARPMVFTTTLLLIVLIAALNVGAIWLRGRLRKRFQSSHF